MTDETPLVKAMESFSADAGTFECIKGCFDCCHFPPLSVTWWNANKHRIVREVVMKSPELDGMIIVCADNAVCPFLGQDARCTVYADRPPICKTYGLVKTLPCIYLNEDGTPRNEKQEHRAQNFWKQRQRAVDAERRKQKAILEQQKKQG